MLETPRRGLMLGRKVPFSQRFMQILRKYHGYLFAWATIYTFWYHPTEGTAGHLLGFFYMFMLFAQSSLIFNRAHLNKWWTFTLEAFVLVHSVAVAIFQGNDLWPMFAFGFGAMIVLTQMHGLGLSRWSRGGLAAGFVVASWSPMAPWGDLAGLTEVVRIPVLEYAVVALVYGLYVGRGSGFRGYSSTGHSGRRQQIDEPFPHSRADMREQNRRNHGRKPRIRVRHCGGHAQGRRNGGHQRSFCSQAQACRQEACRNSGR